MPVIDERRTASRSALRYRPLPTGDQAFSQPGPLVARASRRAYPDAHFTTAPGLADGSRQEDEDEPPHRQQQTAPSPRRITASSRRAGQHPHPLIFIVAGMLVALLLGVGFTQALAWGSNEYNTLIYGYPRSFQIDAVVGHNDSPSHPSHFLALNLSGQIEVVEWPGGDDAHARIFVGPRLFGPGNDLEPVTLSFRKMDGNPFPNMIINVKGDQIIWVNEQGTFRPLSPNTLTMRFIWHKAS